MPDKTLKSLKFPGLSGTYRIPQLATDYNPDFTYEYGDYCTYQGQLYVCAYRPIDIDDNWGITGPFNEDYWDLVPNVKRGYADYISSYLAPYDYYYDPSTRYMAGELMVLQVDPPGGDVYRCIKDTPNPAGSFDENYWVFVGSDFIRDLLSQEQLQINTKSQLFDQESRILDSVLLNYIPSDSPEDDDPFQPWKIVGKDSDTNSFRFAYRIVDLNESFSYLLSIFSNQDHEFSVFYYYGYADTALIEDIDFPINDNDHSWKSLEAYDWSSDDPIKIDETSYSGFCFASRINFPTDNHSSSRLVIAICSQERDEQEDISNMTYSDLEDVTSQLILSRLCLEDLNMSYDKNDPRAIRQFLNLADGYLKGSGIYMINQPTFLQADCKYRYPTDDGHFNFTASTFVQSCLRGFSFDNTPYSVNWTWYQPPSSSVPWQYPAGDGQHTIPYNCWIPNKWQYSWAINPYDDKRYAWAVDSTNFITETRTLEEVTTQVSPGQMFNECGALARWMVDKGWMVDTGFKLPHIESIGDIYFEYNNMNISCIQPGDILFFAEKCQWEDGTIDYISDGLYGDKYNHISHVSIVADVQLRGNISLDPFGSEDSYHNYSIIFYDSPSLALNLISDANSKFELNKTFLNEINRVEKDGAVYCLPSYETLCLVCRPDLHSSKETYLESEARKLGLHTVPENAMQLEIIRRCRLCSDIEWTPGRDYDRPMPLTTSTRNYSGYGFTTTGSGTTYSYTLTGEAFNQNFDPQYDIIIDGKFKQGTKYKGLPWTAKIPENATSDYPVGLYSNDIMCPEQFVSTITNENALTYIDSQNKVYPIYGWNQPMDFIKFVFDNQSFGGYSIEARFAHGGVGFNQDLLLDEPTTAYPGADAEWKSEFIDEILKLGQIVHSQLSSTFYQNKLFTAVGIVTDFIKDENNVVKYIEVTEATRYGLINPNDSDGQYGNLIRRKMFSVPEFCDWFNFTYLNNY